MLEVLLILLTKQIADLRSQQVRDVCTLLIYLGKVAGERMKPFLRDAFVHILEGVKVPNKVMSGYVDDCIQNLIRYCTFKTGIPLLVMEIKDSKAKLVREKCLVNQSTTSKIICFFYFNVTHHLSCLGISQLHIAFLGFD